MTYIDRGIVFFIVLSTFTLTLDFNSFATNIIF